MTNHIRTVSHWDVSVDNEYLQQNSDTLVILFPGNKYLINDSYLHYAYNVAYQCGYDVLALEYGFQKADKKLNPETEMEILINEMKDTVEECLHQKRYRNVICIGKSLGAYLQSTLMEELVKYTTKFVYLTPTEQSIEGIRQSDCVVVIGDKDPLFTKEHLKKIVSRKNVRVKVVEDVGHNLERADYNESITILLDIMDTIYEFIHEI